MSDIGNGRNTSFEITYTSTQYGAQNFTLEYRTYKPMYMPCASCRENYQRSITSQDQTPTVNLFHQ
ncbi:hypothetical protein BVRB_7g176020 [Beta vulgaris subsp. vulgaris]|nr:hypothetical protein BVRB_7g176020 [Beta vulgaris subsp. vulgaris]